MFFVTPGLLNGKTIVLGCENDVFDSQKRCFWMSNIVFLSAKYSVFEVQTDSICTQNRLYFHPN